MKPKNIWIINEYAGTPYHGMEFRHYYLGKELVKLGNSVTVVSSSYSHLFKNLPKQKKENIDGVDYLWLPTLNYGTSHDKRRVLKWFIFMFKVFFLPLSLRRPDVIIVSPMAPFPIFPAWILSKIYKAKLIYEVKDIWPLSLVELGGFKPSHPFIKLMAWFERFALLKSNVIVSNLQNYGEHMQKDLGIDRDFEWISNGVDLDELSQIEPLDENIKQVMPKDKFIVGYTGTVGVANALESFCEAAKLLEQNKEILFVIVGDGQEKQNLMKRYLNAVNILFIDSIPKKQVQSMLGLFDACYIGLQKENLFKYGVSPNKLYDYMYSAKPVVYAIDSGENNIVKTAKCGVSVEAQDAASIADGIKKIYAMKTQEREQIGENAKQYILQYFTYDKLAQKYQNLMEK
ncbi:glycosyltransferase family 4 protein [Sulfurimonas sp.]|uniref:glycosyltransferase family 4 protein n=1 Tax=Sulfurimonas sp. TaxID=2022749 RepID=UPI0026052775|nr:glycosyltransferase family 4 protein [Sulfurimonas sp.]